MKKLLYSLLALLLFSQTSFSQTAISWGVAWDTVYPTNALPSEPRVQINFALAKCDGKGGLTGQPGGVSYYRIKNDFSNGKGYLKFTIEYRKCDGTIGSFVVACDLSKPGMDDYVGNHFYGNEITRIYNIVPPEDPDKKQAENLKPKLDDAKTQFDQTYITYQRGINNIQNVQLRNQYQAALTNSQTQFTGDYNLALQYYKQGSGDKLSAKLTDLQNVKAQLDKNLNLMNDVVERQGKVPAQQAAPVAVNRNNAAGSNVSSRQTQAQSNNTTLQPQPIATQVNININAGQNNDLATGFMNEYNATSGVVDSKHAENQSLRTEVDQKKDNVKDSIKGAFTSLTFSPPDSASKKPDTTATKKLKTNKP